MLLEALVESEEISTKPVEQLIGFNRNSQYVHYCDNETISGVACDLSECTS